jgi:aryl-alcohol dehydrogenase-like predicted oxidoreductase
MLMSRNRSKLTRRIALQAGLATAASLAMPRLASSTENEAVAGLIEKPIPSTGERLPVIGLGTNAYGASDPDEVAARREVLEEFPKLGARVVDTARAYGDSELVIGRLVAELGIRRMLFLATKTPMRGELKPGTGELEEALKRLQTDRIDLMQIHNFYGTDELFPRLVDWKAAGKVRYVGVTTSTDEQYPLMDESLRKRPLDFIQVDYSIENRGCEKAILPLAQDRGVAVLINMPLGGRRGKLLSKVTGRPLPPWARELDATSWAQVLLKYVVSHPAVTAAIPGTTKLAHLRDNQLAARGRLPDAGERRRIEEYWSTL